MRRMLILLLIVPAAVVYTCCSTSDSTTSTTGPVEPFVLTVPAVDLGRVFEFLPFGYDFGGGRLNPTYEFRASPQSLPVYAAAGGMVEAVVYQSSQSDWEIRIRHEEHGEYLLIYDHVKGPEVEVGDAVEPGDVLGTLGDWPGDAGRVEFQVNVSRSGRDAHICPRSVGSASFNAAHDEAFARAGEGGDSVCLLDEFNP